MLDASDYWATYQAVILGQSKKLRRDLNKGC